MGLVVRLFGFALPHWRTVLLAVAGMMVYAGARATQIALAKPAAACMNRLEGVPRAGTASRADKPANPVESLKHGLVRRVRSLGIVRRAENLWLRATSTLLGIGVVALSLAPVLFVATFWHEYLREKVRWCVVVDIRNALCNCLLPYSLSFFENRRSGELISSLTNDILTVQRSLI